MSFSFGWREGGYAPAAPPSSAGRARWASSYRRSTSRTLGQRTRAASRGASLEPDQITRATAFLQPRAIIRSPSALDEALLVQGDRVVVHGAERDEAEPALADYRTLRRRRLLGDSDGSPVLIEPAG